MCIFGDVLQSYACLSHDTYNNVILFIKHGLHVMMYNIRDNVSNKKIVHYGPPAFLGRNDWNVQLCSRVLDAQPAETGKRRRRRRWRWTIWRSSSDGVGLGSLEARSSLLLRTLLHTSSNTSWLPVPGG